MNETNDPTMSDARDIDKRFDAIEGALEQLASQIAAAGGGGDTLDPQAEQDRHRQIELLERIAEAAETAASTASARQGIVP